MSNVTTIEKAKEALKQSKPDHEPIPLPDTLPPVQPFSYMMMPRAFAGWVDDTAERMQCPPDYVAVSAMVSAAAVIGRKIGIRPKKSDSGFEVVPNLWGMLIGRPSQMKTPAMREAMKPLKRLETAERDRFDRRKVEFEADQELWELSGKATKSEAAKLVKKGDSEAARGLLVEHHQRNPSPPAWKRYIINDSSVEKVGELLNENPNGLLLERDELSGWMRTLIREDRTNDRAFYLEAFNGNGTYTYDRIGRGTVCIESVCISIIGTIQPGILAPYLHSAITQGAGDDGLAQRFQLAVYPDPIKDWRYVDRYPDRSSKEAVDEVFNRLATLEPPEPHEFDAIYYTQFAPDAQELFIEWITQLEAEVHSMDLHPAMEAHLTKYRSLIPSLALIIQLCELDDLTVSRHALERAIQWGQYLRSHAERIYSMSTDLTTANARHILEKIKGGSLKMRFKPRDIQNKQWTGLHRIEDVKKALDVLEEHHWVTRTETRPPNRGRPSISYRINPKVTVQKK